MGQNYKLKIILYYPEDLRKLSGTPFRILRLAEFLSKEGHDITLVSKDINEEDIINFKHLKLKTNNILRYLNIFEINRIIKEIQPDIFLSFTNITLLSSIIPCKLRNVKHIVELHSSFLDEFLFKRGIKLKEKNIFYKILAKINLWIVTSTDHVIVLTDSLLEMYKPYVKTTLMFPGTDKRLFDKKTKPINKLAELKKGYIIGTYSGNFNKYQGIEILFEVIRELKKLNIKDFKFLLMGGDIKPYKEYIKNQQIEDFIIDVGKPPLNKTSQYLSITDFFIVPRPAFEGAKYIFASKYCDYVAMRKPIISTNIGEAAQKLVKKNGILVEPTKEEILKALLKLRDKKILNDLTKEAEKMDIRKYTIEDNIKQFKGIIENLK